jgi:hypothetical protein
MSYVAVKKANNPDDLKPIKRHLESHGIDCEIKNEMPDQVINVVPTPLVELQVKKDDYGQACNILKEFEGRK